MAFPGFQKRFQDSQFDLRIEMPFLSLHIAQRGRGSMRQFRGSVPCEAAAR